VIVQGTPEWRQQRVGCVTASRIKDVLAQGRGSAKSATRENYLTEKVLESLTGEPVEDDISRFPDVAWGIECEPLGRAAYEAHCGVLVSEVGMILHPRIAQAGASPDGLVRTDGMVQIKCPKTKTHLAYLLAGGVPAEYQPQMQWEMACTGRAWNDFASFDPRLPHDLQLFVARLKRDDAAIAAYESAVEEFLSEVSATLARLRTLKQGKS